MERKAQIATHSTSEQAGAFARQISAKNLVLTHFSARQVANPGITPPSSSLLFSALFLFAC